MRIAHVCLSNFYVDGRSYQENELVAQHVRDGHQVLVIASTESQSADGHMHHTTPGEYVGLEGARVHRLPYRQILPRRVMVKLRMNVGVYSELERFRPDVILFHGTCGWELRTVARFIKNNPKIRLFVDSHEDWNNSARGFVSRELLHRQYYGRILRSVLSFTEKILCVSTESMDFVAELYRVPRSKLEFYPLGGNPFGDEEYRRRRENARKELNVAPGQIVLLQAGKQTKRKKLTEALRAFARCDNSALRLFVAGALHEDIRHEAEALIAADHRVTFLGWRSAGELTDLLCAADIYLQPGTQSVTMQQSLCCRCAVIIDDVPAHEVYRCHNGWWLNEKIELYDAFTQIDDANLSEMGDNSFAFASANLSYKRLATRILSAPDLSNSAEHSG